MRLVDSSRFYKGVEIVMEEVQDIILNGLTAGVASGIIVFMFTWLISKVVFFFKQVSH